MTPAPRPTRFLVLHEESFVGRHLPHHHFAFQFELWMYLLIKFAPLAKEKADVSDATAKALAGYLTKCKKNKGWQSHVAGYGDGAAEQMATFIEWLKQGQFVATLHNKNRSLLPMNLN